MKNIKIGLSCSPSFIKSHDLITVSIVLVTYGGGMGGANKMYYATKIERTGELGFILTLHTGEVVEVNTHYVVSVTPARLVKVVSDITGHANYYKPTCNKAIETDYILLKYGEDYNVIPTEFIHRTSGELEGRRISTEVTYK